MIDTTTHSFNHCGGGGGGSAAAAASAVSANSNSGNSRNHHHHHLNSEQHHYQHYQPQYHHHHNHNYTPHNSYNTTSVHHQQQNQQTLTELSSIASDHQRLAGKYNGSQQSNKPAEEQYYYNNQPTESTGYWPNNNNGNSLNSDHQTDADNKTADDQRFISRSNTAADQQQQQLNQWPHQESPSREDRVEKRHQQLDSGGNIYQTSARVGFSPSSAACHLYAANNRTGDLAAACSEEPTTAYADSESAASVCATTTTAATVTTTAAATATITTKDKQASLSPGNEFNQLRILEMRKEKSRDAARSRRSKENHEFYELAKLLPLPAAITSQLDFLDKASIIRLTISFLKLRQFSVNGYPPWAPDFATLGSVNPYSSQSSFALEQHYPGSSDDGTQSSRPTSVKHPVTSPAQTPATSSHRLAAHNYVSPPSMSLSGVVAFSTSQPQIDPAGGYSASEQQQDRSSFTVFNSSSSSEKQHSNNYHSKNATTSLFDIHQGTHILQSLDGFAFAIGRDGRFLYISETVSMYLGLSQVEMTGSSVFDYTHQQDHEELARHLGMQNPTPREGASEANVYQVATTRPGSVHSQYSAASNETMIDDYMNHSSGPPRKRTRGGGGGACQANATARGAYGRASMKKSQLQSATTTTTKIKIEASDNVDTHAGATGRANELSAAKEMLDEEAGLGVGSGGKQGTDEDPLVRQFCIRMKSTLTKRGCQHFKSSGYRVVHVVAHLRSYQSNDHGHLMDPLDEPAMSATSLKQQQQGKKRGPKASTTNKDSKQQETKVATADIRSPESAAGEPRTTMHGKQQKIIGMVAVAIALPPPSINELRLESDTFVLRLSLDLKVTHIEPRITELLHYPVELIAGRSLYSLIHPADVYQVQKCHRDLLSKGQMMSGYYRLLARNGGYIWIQTCATLICNNTPTNLPAPGQVPILPAQSPLSSSNHPMTPLGVDQKLQAGYLAPSNSSGGGGGGGNSLKLLASPGMSSHISSNSYDNMMDQDQCVIFVNYMITNVIESEQMIDVCQSQDFAPVQSAFTASSNNCNNNNNNILYNSPSSSCPSPCISSLKQSISSQNNNNNNNNYAHSTMPTSANISQSSNHHQRRQAIVSHSERSSSSSKEISSKSRRTAASRTPKSSSTYLSSGSNSISDENGAAAYTKLNNDHHHQSLQQQQQQQDEITSNNGALYGNHYQSTTTTPGSVNLALNNNSNNKTADNNHWLASGNHWTSTATTAAATTMNYNGTSTSTAAAAMVYGSSQHQAAAAAAAAAEHHNNHYTGMDRSSIYKAAFGFGAGANYATAAAATGSHPSSHPHSHHHHHHQQQQQQWAQLYPASTGQAVVAYGSAAAAAAVAATPAAAAAVCNSWDNAAAVAAAAAASNHLASHHHHHVATNPYAHLEPYYHHHHHHQQQHNHHY